jgi:4-oxalocrotonate tautomerase family enzyme
MPYVNLQILHGATRQQKAQLVAAITDALVGILDKRPEHVHVVIQEIAEQDWGFAGLPTDEWKRRQQAADAAA